MIPPTPNLPFLIEATAPRFLLTHADRTGFDALRHSLIESYPDQIIRMIRGANCHSKESLIDEISAAFQFPLYAGRNWDALYDLLTDLGWLKKMSPPVATLLIADADQVLIHADNYADPFFDLLRDCATGGRGHEVSWRIVFQVDRSLPTFEYRESHLLTRLSAVGITPIAVG
jgi:hypothetical protein